MGSAKYADIAGEIESKIDQGQFAEGEKLPTHRALARELGTTSMTIAKAYGLLAERGRIESFVGRGSFVKEQSSLKQAIRCQFSGDEWNFSILQPCYTEHMDALHSQLQLSFAELSKPMLYGYHEGSGPLEHKAAGVMWMQRYGVTVRSPEQILLTNGAQHALSILIELYSDPGDCIAVDQWTYPGLLSIACFLKRKVISVAMDAQGMNPDALEEVCRRHNPALVVLLPSHQNPTTISLSQQRREQLAEVIQRNPLWLIEDDIYSFLNAEPIHAITNLIPEKSFFIHGLSKAVSPGLRCGFIKAPQSQVNVLSAFIRATVWMPSPLMFEVARNLIESELAFEMAERQRRLACHRQRLAQKILRNHKFQAQDASYHIWLELPGSWEAGRFALTAKERGLLVSSGSYFSAAGEESRSIRLSLMAISEESFLDEGLRAVNSLLNGSPGR